MLGFLTWTPVIHVTEASTNCWSPLALGQQSLPAAADRRWTEHVFCRHCWVCLPSQLYLGKQLHFSVSLVYFLVPTTCLYPPVPAFCYTFLSLICPVSAGEVLMLSRLSKSVLQGLPLWNFPHYLLAHIMCNKPISGTPTVIFNINTHKRKVIGKLFTLELRCTVNTWCLALSWCPSNRPTSSDSPEKKVMPQLATVK